MAIVATKELPQRTGKTGIDFKREYTRVFEVYSDSILDGPRTISSAIGIGIGTTYASGIDTDLGSFAQSIEVRETERGQSLSKWTITVQYGGVDPTQGGEVTTGSPLEKPVEVRYGTAKFERVVDKDTAGNAILNSAGDPFDPPLVIDDSRPVIQFTRNELTFDAALAYSYRDKLNSAIWNGGAPKTWKINAITGKRDFHAEVGFYWIVDYEFEYNPLTWRKIILNQGMTQKVGGVKKSILSSDGVPISQPAPLSSSGAQVPPSSLPGSAVWLTFDVYETTDFAAFNLV